MAEIRWKFYPTSTPHEDFVKELVELFESYSEKISSDLFDYRSNVVLDILRCPLIEKEYVVGRKGKVNGRIKIPVLLGPDGKVEKYFEGDAYCKKSKTILYVEAGRGVMNNQFMSDYLQACMMIDMEYLVVAVRKKYLVTPDFDRVIGFFNTLYASGKIITELKGVLIIGY